MAKASRRPTSKPLARGRPTAFSDSLAQRILDLALEGKTEAQIARAVGVSVTTLKNWKGARPDFLTALKEAKDVADSLVEAALFQRAVGYSHKAIKFFCHNGSIVSQRYEERYAPDTTAAIFWLKNRQPDRWRDVHKLEHSGKDGGPIATQVTVVAVEQAIERALNDAGSASEDF